jgi:hypothetical protein
MKCVPIRPFVLAPQMKKVPARIQNEPVFEARPSSPKASTIGFCEIGARGRSLGGAVRE